MANNNIVSDTNKRTTENASPSVAGTSSFKPLYFSGNFAFSGKGNVEKEVVKPLEITSDISQKKCYYIYPIGSTLNSGSPRKAVPKYTDIASVLNLGLRKHWNLGSRESTKFETLATLIHGVNVNTVINNLRLFAVRPVPSNYVCLQSLMELNEKRHVFNEEHARFTCANIMMALKFLHQHMIFHGSINPKKVVFNDKKYPCLTGFETAEVKGERQSRPRERVSLSYSSPEQLYNHFVTESTDIYSTGCLVYAMVYGKPPHAGEDSAVTRRNVSDKKYVPPFKPQPFSKEGQRFILQCIRKEHSNRFSIVHLKGDLLSNVGWFAGLSEDKLYKQVTVSPFSKIIKDCDQKVEK